MPDTNPPEITTGSFVSWDGGKGRVDLIVTSGTVPGVEDEIEATSDSPAARVVVWENGKATRKKVGASTHTLKRIAPIDGDDEKKSDPTAALVALGNTHARHAEEMRLPRTSNLSGKSLKAAYDRGLKSWPGSDVTPLSPVEWAMGRAAHLSKAALGEVSSTNDDDLLDPEHPLGGRAPDMAAPESLPLEVPPSVDDDEGWPEDGPDDDAMSVDRADVDQVLASIEDTLADDD